MTWQHHSLQGKGQRMHFLRISRLRISFAKQLKVLGMSPGILYIIQAVSAENALQGLSYES
jgi:hypothetical protein